MDEIKYKLKTCNSVLIVNAFEKLINIIQQKYKSPECNKDFVYKNEELQLLREKCSDPNATISLTACQALLSLVEYGVLDISQTLSTFITLLPNARNYPAMITSLAGLLLLDLKHQLRNKQIYECQLSLKAPQHPFIMVMEQDPETADDIIAQMSAICQNHDYIVQQNSLEVLRPVYLWLTCNPGRFTNEWGQKTLQLLLSVNQHKMQEELIIECLTWQLLSRPKQTQSTFLTYTLMVDAALQQKNVANLNALLPILAKISKCYIEQGFDPRICYSCIDKCISSSVDLRLAAGLTLMLLSKNVAVTPSLYLSDLLRLCQKIITIYEIQSLPLSMLVANILQWLYYPSQLTEESLIVAAKILNHYKEVQPSNKFTAPTLNSNKLFRILMRTDSEIFLNLELLKKWEIWREGEQENAGNWFESIDKYSNDVKNKMASFFLAVFLDCKNETVSMRALKIVLKLLSKNKELSVIFLPVLIYRLSNCKTPELKVSCLKALPLMAIAKENVPTVVALLNKMRKSKLIPTSMLIHCFCALAEVQVRCFPYLHEMLTEKVQLGANDVNWEVEMAKMDTVIKLCENSNHGPELVSVISSALATNSDPSVCASAVRAARALVHSGALHAPAAARALPKNAKSPIVQASICDLLSEVPVGLPENIESNSITTTCLKILWQYVTDSMEPMVIERACIAISCYKLEDMALKHIPEIYREGIGLPAEFCKTPIDAARKPEDVIDYVPAEVWPNVFKYTNQSALEGVKKLCQAYISREIKAFRSGVYATDARTGEPTNMAYLSCRSVLRGLMEFIRKQAVHPSYDCPPSALAAILECVASEYPRPLPPMTYAHLPELVSRVSLCNKGAFTLAARQALVSGSARVYVDTYLIGLDPTRCEDSESEMVFELLPIISKTVRPDIIRQFIDKFISHHYSVHCIASDNSDGQKFGFIDIWKYIALSLSDEKIHEANRTLLSSIVKNYFFLIRIGTSAWSTYCQACVSLSLDHIESLTSPLNWWETQAEVILKSSDIRCILACTEKDPTWMNDIIDVVVGYPSEHAFVLSRLSTCLLVCSSNQKTNSWFMQLLARVQVAFNSESIDGKGVEFLCNCVSVACALLSGLGAIHLRCTLPVGNMFKDSKTEVFSSRLLSAMKSDEPLISLDVCESIFPSAMESIASRASQDDQTRIVEWLHHSRSINRLGEEFKRTLHLALVACRHCDHYNQVWTKLLSVKPTVLLV